MSKTLKDFARAADEIVKEDSRFGSWMVYDHYEKVRIDENDAYVRVPSFLDRVPGEAQLRVPVKSQYDPFASKGLFLEFAELAEHGDVTQEAWLDWTRNYGVLGVDWLKGPVDLHRGGPHEKFSIFREEAEIANRVLRLFEAATADDGPNVPAIRESLELKSRPTVTSKELKGWALSEVALVVQRRLASESFPRLYRREDFTFYHSPSGFGSLIGAMYLQMMWLMTATEKVRRCAGPQCDKIIYFESDAGPDNREQRERGVRGIYRNRKYCSVNCRVKRWQRDTKKSQHLRN